MKGRDLVYVYMYIGIKRLDVCMCGVAILVPSSLPIITFIIFHFIWYM